MLIKNGNIVQFPDSRIVVHPSQILGPKQTGSCVAWYEAAYANGIDVAQPSNGSLITTWKDLSGNGIDLSYVSGGGLNKGKMEIAGTYDKDINFNSITYYKSANTSVMGHAPFTFSQAFTFILALTYYDNTGNVIPLFSFSNSTNGHGSFGAYFQSQTMMMYDGSGNYFGPSAKPNTQYLYVFKKPANSTTITGRLNNSTYSFTWSSVTFSEPWYITLGAPVTSWSTNYVFRHASLYSSFLADTDIFKIYNYANLPK